MKTACTASAVIVCATAPVFAGYDIFGSPIGGAPAANVVIDFESLPLGLLEAGDEIAPGIVLTAIFGGDVGAEIFERAPGNKALRLIQEDVSGLNFFTDRAIFTTPQEIQRFELTTYVIDEEPNEQGNPALRLIDSAGDFSLNAGWAATEEGSFRRFEYDGVGNPGVAFEFRSSISNTDSIWAFDEVSIWYVPSPGAAAMLGFAGFAGLRRRRA